MATIFHLACWWALFLPLAWIGMWTVLFLFSLGIGIAVATRFPVLSVARLLVPMKDRTAQAKQWMGSLTRNGGYNWKPSLQSDDSAPEAVLLPPITTLQLRHGECRYIIDKPDGPAVGDVVLLHGVSMLCDMWQQQAVELRGQGYRVIRFDFYGHGHSTCDPSLKYDLELFEEQTHEVLSHLCPGAPPSLVGFSLGGLVAAAYTARHPDRVQRLCLVDSCGFAAPPLPLSCFPAYLCHGIYSVVRCNPIRRLSSISGGVLLKVFAHAYDVTHSDVMAAFDAIQHFQGLVGI